METLRNPQPRKPVRRGRRRRRRRHRRQKKRNRPLATKPFAFAPISFPNNGSASQFRATPIPIGSKPGDNYWPSGEKADSFRTDELLLFVDQHSSTPHSFGKLTLRPQPLNPAQLR